MIKIVHIALAMTSFTGFVFRVVLAETRPGLLQQKWLKISPHVIDTLLLISGVTLVIQGQWLNGNFTWLVVKILVLFGYIGLGITVMHTQGKGRWVAFCGAVICFIYMVMLALTKNPLIYF